MKTTKITKGLLVITAVSGIFAVGCELIVDFDRTKIPVEVAETSIPDTGIPETSTPGEGGTDAGSDADADTTDADAGDLDAADADGG